MFASSPVAETATIMFWRTVFFYVSLLLVMRIMGKREIGRLSPADVVVTIMLADAAIIAIEDTKLPLWVGVIPVATLAAFEILFSWLSLRSPLLRDLTNGRPSIIIERGRINRQEMKKLRYGLHDLLSQLRRKDVYNVQDVEYALLEPTGDLTLILKPEKRPVTPGDLGLSPPKEGLPLDLIIDGTVDEQALERSGHTREWLDRLLKERGYTSPKEVFLATLNRQGELFIQPTDKL